jgi:hypothetical protein
MDSSPDEAAIAALLTLPTLMESGLDLARRGRFVTLDCAVGTPAAPVYLRIEEGRVTDAVRGPALMRSVRFSYRATGEAWAAFWQPMPAPGFHDLLALTKRGAATLEGDLQPFVANLQYFKDLLALPRGGAR